MHGGHGLTGSFLAVTDHTLSLLSEKDDAPNLNVSLNVCSNATLFSLSSSIPLAEMVKYNTGRLHLRNEYLETVY